MTTNSNILHVPRKSLFTLYANAIYLRVARFGERPRWPELQARVIDFFENRNVKFSKVSKKNKNHNIIIIFFNTARL